MAPVAPPPYRPTQEVRFAVVLYGGVSLAIYINGVVQELLRLVRATAPEASGDANPQQAWLREDQLTGSERVYRRLGQMLEWSRPPQQQEPRPEAPVRTRFVVDILSGSSAGGINGIFLAKALANEQHIEQLRDLWIDEGDIALLVNDRGSYDGLELSPQRPPRSLLNSRRMYWQLLRALDGMDEDAQAAPASRFVDELDLWITTTDIDGLLLPIDLYDRVVYEPRHRNVLHFRYGSDYGRGDRANDFVRANNPLLAFAGRSTSAFPFAFEPMTLEDVDEVVRTDAFHRYAGGHAGAPGWRRFFHDYVDARRRPDHDSGGDDRYYRKTAFGDGGYLDNKPFTHATRTLRRRRADLPVDRRLIYIEPDPGRRRARVTEPRGVGDPPAPPAWTPPSDRPDPFQNVQAALLTLPRTEPIRDDLLALLERNREIARVADIVALVDRTANEFADLAIPPRSVAEWRATPLADVVRERGGLQYLAYYRLKIATVLDELAALLTTISGFSEDSDEYSGVRCLVQAWFERRFPEAAPGPGQQTQNEFLLRFDVSYRLRRLSFVNDRIDELLRLDARSQRIWSRFAGSSSVDRIDPSTEKRLLDAKRDLNGIFIELRASTRQLWRRDPANPLVAALGALGLAREDLLGLLDGARSKDESVERAHSLLDQRPLEAPLDAVADAVAAALEAPLLDAATKAERVLGIVRPEPGAAVNDPDNETAAGRALHHFYVQYESYDAVLFPVSYGVIGEADRVEVVRVSPQDAPSLIDETSPADGRQKLAGTSIHHFGGFFERAWRKNDLLWGRLDAAERIIDSMLLAGDVPDALREKLRKDAQLAIIEEEFETSDREPLVALVTQTLLAGDGDRRPSDPLAGLRSGGRVREAVEATIDPERIWEHLATDYEVNRELDRQRLLDTVGRSTQVTGRLFDGLTDRYEVLRRPARWLVRIGRIMWGVVEAATPRTFPQLLLRYWLSLLVLVSLLLIVGGALLGAPATAKAGWVLLLIVFGTRLAVWITEDLVARRIRWALVPIFLVLAAVVGLAAAETILHLGDDLDRFLEWLPEWAEDAVRWAWPWDDGEG